MSAVGPGLNALSMLLIFKPLTDILGSVFVIISSVAMGFVIEPLSLINIAVVVDEPASAVSHVVGPGALVFGPIFPHLQSLAVPFAFFGPLARIGCSVAEFIRSSIDQPFTVERLMLKVKEKRAKLRFGFSRVFIRVIRQRRDRLGILKLVPA